ncbi:MAG TPA: glycosidase [Rubricoccaceae bacterium]|jgi:predicted GH43/DUF377 family glycosyl hydrolase
MTPAPPVTDRTSDRSARPDPTAVALFARTPAPVLAPAPGVAWASGALFNPGAALGDDGTLRLLARGVAAGHRRVDVLHADEHEPRFGFEGYVSALGLATRGADGLFTLAPEPLLAPSGEVDRYGCEDARITRLGDRWWITYTALAEPAATATHGVGIALASTTDWQTVTRHGRIGPAVRDKDAALFPGLVGGRIAMFHRIAPDVQIVFFEDEEQMLAPGARFWEHELAHLDDSVVLRPERPWEAKKVGMGPPPIWTPEGWLVVYHAADAAHVYRAGLALLDLDDPRRVVARTRRPVLAPELAWERHGDVPNVVFPEGATVEAGADGQPALNLYYGAADCAIGHAHAPLADVLDLLREEAKRPALVPPVTFDYAGHRDRRRTLGTSTVAVERLHGGRPVLEPVPEHPWESGVVLNPAAVLVAPGPDLERMMGVWALADAQRDRLRNAGGACVMLYRAQGTAFERDTPVGAHFPSSLGLAVFTPDLQLVYRAAEPTIAPEAPFHDLGVEDARCTRVGDTYYLHYTGYTSEPGPGTGGLSHGAAGRVQLCLATTQDFASWTLHGPVPGDVNRHGDKNGALFPEPAARPGEAPRWWLWHRPMEGRHPMAMHLASAETPDGPWTSHGCALASYRFHDHALSWVGAAGPPVALGGGRFLALYHQGHLSFESRRLYNLSAVLVEPAAPEPVVARTEPILVPEGDAEQRGDATLGVDNVVFSCANYVVGEHLVIPYAGADSRIFGARLVLADLVAHLHSVRDGAATDAPLA